MARYNGADIKRSKPNKGVDAKMEQNLIRPMTAEYEEYLRDESRSVGHGESISFPKSTQQIQAVLKQLQASGTPVTLQGSRTGLTAAAVPDGGHVMNLSRMDRVLGCRQDDQGAFYLTVQPGVLLAELRKKIRNKNFDTTGWDEASLRAYTAFCRAPEQFFTPDPTETSASLGGMVNCNASGARSLYYGSVRPYVSRLKMVLADGDTLTIRRGEHFAKERQGALRTDSGRLIQIPLPTYQMPHTKNASGYYAADDMDLIDLFIGADGTLGVTAEIEIRLVPLPPIVWGVTAFFDREEKALRYVRLIRGEVLEEGQQPFVLRPVSAEFFNGDALEILRRQKRENSAFAQIHDIPARYQAAIYVELHGEQEEEVLARLLELGRAITMAGGDEGDTWVARDQSDLDRLMFFRHAIPECVEHADRQTEAEGQDHHQTGHGYGCTRQPAGRGDGPVQPHAAGAGAGIGHLGPHRQQPPPCQHPAQRWGGVQKRPAALPPVGRLCDGKRGRGLGGTRCGQAESRVFAGDVRAGAHPADAPAQAGL